MNCYHCKRKLNLESTPDGLYHCPDCIAEYGLHDVLMCGDGCDDEKEEVPLFFHIFVTFDDYKVIRVPALNPSFFQRDMYFQVGHKYHVRLHLRENYTSIAAPTDSDYNHIMNVPGFPITPANIREKLKIYILFS